MLFVFVWIVSRTTDLYTTEEIAAYQNRIFSFNTSLFYLLSAIALMPINWIIESTKWKISLNNQIKLSNWAALKSILAGVTLGIITPNRIGNFIGRIMTIPPKNRAQGILANSICGFSQLIVTLLFGSVSLIILLPNYIKSSYEIYQFLLQGICVLLILVLTLLYYRSTKLLKWLTQFEWLRSLINKPTFSSKIDSQILSPILFRSILRYMVFTVQYVLLLYFFEVKFLNYTNYFLVPIIYLSLAIIPTLALSELGVREGAALVILGAFSENDLAIISASFAIWTINIAVPALLGCLVILQNRFIIKSK